jgi:SAM-dependent methyltransferase
MRLAMTLIDVARRLARSVPAPRGTPYFGLDAGVSYGLELFDALSERSIFRKYEFALEIGAGLGGRARWIAARLGCHILGVETRSETVAAALVLNQRAHMEGQVMFQVADPDHLPLRERVFTHVWCLDASSEDWTESRLAEAFRVVRRGGHFVLQAVDVLPTLRASLLAALEKVGFSEIEWRKVGVEEIPTSWRVSQNRLAAALSADPVALATWQRLASPPPVRLLQVFARRPA